MSKSTAYIFLAIAIVAALVVGGLVFYRNTDQPQTAEVPPLPASAVPFGQWALIGCQTAAGDGACRLVRRVINNEAQRVVLSFTVTRIPNGTGLMVIGLPPSVIIPRGVTIIPEGGTAAIGRVIRCGPQICTAALPLSETFVTEMLGAQSFSLQFVAANGQNVNLSFPIAGFSEGFQAWIAASPPPEDSAAEDSSVADETIPDAELVE